MVLWVNKKGSKGGGGRRTTTTKKKAKMGLTKLEAMKELDANCNLPLLLYFEIIQ